MMVFIQTSKEEQVDEDDFTTAATAKAVVMELKEVHDGVIIHTCLYVYLAAIDIGLFAGRTPKLSGSYETCTRWLIYLIAYQWST